ncbi:MAG: response regulator [Phyllobacteriaceae bacterium]|nr:response regulator [Phyllobacteriaceae bacterium]
MTPAQILVVDDDPAIRSVVTFALEKAGHVTRSAADWMAALAALAAAPADLVVLDVGMPEMDGLAVCREIRRTSDLPILFLSARDEEIDRVLGLEIGGDDYVTKPFSPRELVARVGVILKRSRTGRTVEAPGPRLERGVLALDAEARRVFVADRPVAFTGLEFAILRTLMSRPNRVFERGEIIEAAWEGAIHVSDRTIDSHVRNIRAKLAEAGCADPIETVHAVGFRLGPCEAAR